VAGILVSAQEPRSVSDEVVRLERAEGEAMIKKDRAAFQRLYADDYSYQHSNGVMANKAEDIGQNTSSDVAWTSYSTG